MQDPKVRLTRDARAGGGAVEAAVGADGTFEFSRVPAGVYAVSTQGLSASFASTLTVGDADIPDFTIALAGIANPFPTFPGSSVALSVQVPEWRYGVAGTRFRLNTPVLNALV
jgi:hypothetical protein